MVGCLFFACGWGTPHPPDWWALLALAAYAVLITSWFVLPMGALLGVVMPSVVRGCSFGSAIFRGTLLGISAGVLAAGLTTLFLLFNVGPEIELRNVRDLFVLYSSTMVPFCALWVGVWACRWRRRAEPGAAPNGGPATPLGSSGVTEGPPSVS